MPYGPLTTATLQLLQMGRSAGGVLLVFMLFFLVVTAAWLYAAYWVYNDARRRGSDNAAIWGVGVFLIGFLGLLLYLVVRDEVGGPSGY